MIRSRNMVVLVLILVVAVVAWASAHGTLVDQKSVLSGKVLADCLISPEADVHEGDILVVVDTITGSVPAVRANIDGKVKQVLVKPGDMIKSDQVVVRIDPAR